jgi:hypothetical protein
LICINGTWRVPAIVNLIHYKQHSAASVALVPSSQDAQFFDVPETAIELAVPVDLIGTAESLGRAICQLVDHGQLRSQ